MKVENNGLIQNRYFRELNKKQLKNLKYASGKTS